MKTESAISITAIISITVLEVYAISKGIDGVLFAGVIAVIAGLAGFQAKTLLQKIKSRRPPDKPAR